MTRSNILTIAGITAALAFALLLMTGAGWGASGPNAALGYGERLFDQSRVHEIDIIIEDWEGFLLSAPEEEYSPCIIEIDGETFAGVGIRAKGNNSLGLVEQYGLSRYSLKVEMDQYREGMSCHGLDKFSLDASFQDNSYLKAHMAYDMMDFMGVPSPLTSYAFVTVNGEDWGLFLVVEEPEEAFARRNFGANHGRLYKPDYKRIDAENADVALRYMGYDPALYDNIFRKARFPVTTPDKARLIEALRILSTGENLDQAVDIDRVLRYFTVQSFVVNLDSYLGATGHNYFLYEENGVLSMLPWDYNLAFGTYALGMENPINDSTLLINQPIDTPAEGHIMVNRPMFHQLMLHQENFGQYRAYLDQFIRDYFESGLFESKVDAVTEMIAPYVENDPTAFCSYGDYLVGVETFKEFCLLRAESVRGQLAGSIPSTIAGQQQNPDARVDASSLWIPDMGEVADLKD